MKIDSLQGAARVAAWLVVADHALIELTANNLRDLITHLAWRLGTAGVCVLLIISGFIMVHICRDRFGQAGAAANFLRRRIIRIVPLYWIATILALFYYKVSAPHGAHAS